MGPIPWYMNSREMFVFGILYVDHEEVGDWVREWFILDWFKIGCICN